jgi:hypothetical protein
MDSLRAAGLSARRDGLHLERGAQDLAVVGAVAVALPQHLCGHFFDLAGIAHLSGTHQGQRHCFAAGMVGVVSIGNAVGRVFWAWTSDTITRGWTFAVMFLEQVALFWLLPSLSSVAVVTVVSFIILMCYGGGFGTMPAFAADYFGSRNVGPVYGLMLTAWGAASAFGPLLIANLRQSSGGYAGGLHIIAGIMAVSILVSHCRVSSEVARLRACPGSIRAGVQYF